MDVGDSIDRHAFLARFADVADSLAVYLDADAKVRDLAGPTYAQNKAARAAGDRVCRRLAGAPPAKVDDEAETIAKSVDTHPNRSPRNLSVPSEFGRYLVERLLGEGAIGAVYLAHDRQLDRSVALKIPKFQSTADAELLERFQRKARAVATLHHPNVCPVYDVGEIDGRTFLSMGFIDGRPLSDYIKSQGKQNERTAAKLVIQLARALAEAHAAGVVHRDLKPANVMVNKRGEPVVMDFGLAHRLDSDDTRVTRDGMILGTPAYMSPEQVEADPDAVGPASDQYSLGVILYELLTGQLPFQGSVLSVIGQVAHTNPRLIEELRPDLDPRLAAVCRKMMAKAPGDRYADMEAAAEALERWLAESKSGAAAGASLWSVMPDDQSAESRLNASGVAPRSARGRRGVVSAAVCWPSSWPPSCCIGRRPRELSASRSPTRRSRSSCLERP